MLKLKRILLLVMTLATLFSFQVVDAQESKPMPTPVELINTVNALRLANGLPPLNMHPVLLQIAQTEVEGIAAGIGGHWRPSSITLGQWLLSLGYPLSGDSSLDGYRSENFVAVPTSFTPRPPAQFQTPTPQPTEEYSAPDQKANTFSFGAIAIATLFLGGLFTAIARKKN